MQPQGTWVLVRPRFHRWRLDRQLSTAALIFGCHRPRSRPSAARVATEAGVIGSFLLLARSPAGRTRRELGRDIEHELARSHQLLGQQVAEPPAPSTASPLRQAPPTPPGRSAWAARGAHPQAVPAAPPSRQPPPRVARPVRVDAIITAAINGSLSSKKDRG